MTANEAIKILEVAKAECEWNAPLDYQEAFDLAISVLQEQDSKTRRICDTCKHNPVSKKWPCVDCDMREPADRWEPQEVNNSTQEAKNLTQNALDTISRTAAVEVLKGLPTWWADEGGYYGGAQPPMVALLDPEDAVSAIENLPSAQPEPCEDAVSRKAVYEAMIEKGQRSRRYRLGETWELNGAEIRETLDTVPPVTPKRKTGKWVNNIHDLPVCDQCGYMTPYDRAIDDYEYGNYCPNCGAKMNGGDGIKEGSKDV